MKKKILLFTLLTTSLLMTGCDPNTSSSSSSSPSESIQEVHVDSIKITNTDVTMKIGEVLTLNVNVLPNNAVNKLVIMNQVILLSHRLILMVKLQQEKWVIVRLKQLVMMTHQNLMK